MATSTVYLTGVAHWAKLKTPDEKYNTWSLDLSLDDKGREAFNKSGLQLETKINEKGNFEYVRLRRPVSRLIKGELVKFNPPTLLDKDSKPFDDLVGNGSKVTCKVVFYDTVKGKGHRLESVRVEDLVEYKKDVVVNDIEVPF